MIRYLFLVFGLTAVVIMLVAGKRGDFSRRPPIEVFPDMDRQPKLRPQTATDAFPDGLTSRLPIEGTIARDYPWEDNAINTGKVPGTTNYVATIPIPVTQELMLRGRDRFQINCAPCHGPEGDGKGITTKFGMSVIASLHDAASRKVVQQSDGEIFNTISNGKLLMGPYAANITIKDRWAIVAYVRALQRSHLASLEDVSADERDALAKTLPPTATATPPPKP